MEVKYVDYRVSKSTWIYDAEHKYIKAINERVADMTGLSLNSAEPLHIVNYGIGGFYDTHFDWTTKNDLSFDELGIGNRIASIIFYVILTRLHGETYRTN